VSWIGFKIVYNTQNIFLTSIRNITYLMFGFFESVDSIDAVFLWLICRLVI